MEIVNLSERRKAEQKKVGEVLGSKHDIMTSEGIKLIFEFGPCRNPICFGNIKYKVKQGLPEGMEHSPFQMIIPEYHTAIDCCVNRNWKKPWEYLLSPKDLVLKRVNEVKKHIHAMDKIQADAKDLREQIEL